jgi:hypothetical protein
MGLRRGWETRIERDFGGSCLALVGAAVGVSYSTPMAPRVVPGGGSFLPACGARRRWVPTRRPKRTVLRYWALLLGGACGSLYHTSVLARQTTTLSPLLLYWW